MTIPPPFANPSASTPISLSRDRFRLPARRGIVPTVILLAGTSVLTGCGGGGGDSNGNGALIRAVDASTNGGQVQVYLNGTNFTGTQNFFGNSFYLNLDSGNDTFTFTLNAQSGSYPGISQSVSSGSYYSAIVLGRSDITTATDPRYPRIKVISDDPTAPAAGQTRLRVILAAPDAPSVDVLIDGQVAASNVAYTSVGSYFSLAGGNHTVQINQTGTSTALMTAQTVSPAAGLVYSLYVLEATVAPTPTYTVELLGDAR